jgi:serine/threonine protein kinase
VVRLVKPIAGGRTAHLLTSPPLNLKPSCVTDAVGGNESRIVLTARGLRNIQHIALSLVSALLVLRNEGVIHADIKPENCFLRSRSDDKLDTTGSPAGNISINDVDVSDLEVHLGDFGNAIVLSEASLYYTDFEIQSLPYRAPEVLLGLPFAAPIDMWSLGVLLAELCIGDPLFVAKDREEMVRHLSRRLEPLCPVRFSGGMYSNLLCDTQSTSSRVAIPHNAALHMKAVKRLLTKSMPAEAHGVLTGDLLHFLSGLLTSDPRLRLTPQEALVQPFLAELNVLPHSVLVSGVAGQAGDNCRSSSGSVKSRVAAASATQLRGRVTHPVVPRRPAVHPGQDSVNAATSAELDKPCLSKRVVAEEVGLTTASWAHAGGTGTLSAASGAQDIGRKRELTDMQSGMRPQGGFSKFSRIL